MTQAFSGWRVVAGAFTIAVFGWGLGFYGPPVYLHAVTAERGWPVAWVSAAVTLHFLVGALVVARLPRLHARFGLARVTWSGSVLLVVGLLGWSAAFAPWQIFAAALLTGAGWVTLGAAAVNAIIQPWFIKQRPRALSMAYIGASIGGVIFSPAWVLLIGWLGFQGAALLVGAVTLVVIGWLMRGVTARRPEELGQSPDGDPNAAPPAPPNAAMDGAALWRDWRFRTLAAGMALGLFAQIGLIAHLFSLMVPALGAAWAGLVAGLATASATLGRTAFGWLLRPGVDRRRAAALSYAVQIGGVVALLASGLAEPWLILLGVFLFGFGIGNATSLPPLIAQAEFPPWQTARVVALIVALAQGAYAFAPGIFGLLRDATGDATAMLVLAACIKGLAILAFVAGRARIAAA